MYAVEDVLCVVDGRGSKRERRRRGVYGLGKLKMRMGHPPRRMIVVVVS